MGSRRFAVLLACTLFAGGCLDDGLVNSDSSDTTTSAPPAQNFVVAAVGLDAQPAVLQFTVPAATNSDITGAILRWVGRGTRPAGDPTLLVNGHQRPGTLISSRNVGGDSPWLFVYEYDASVLVRRGINRLYVGGFDLGGPMRTDGVAVAVSYNDPSSPWTAIHVVEPNEFVSSGVGAVWSFPIGYSRDTRSGRFVVVVGDCEPARSDRIWWSTGPGSAPTSLVNTAPNVFENRLAAAAGNWMDLLEADLAIPGGAAHFAYQLESPSGGSGDDIVHLVGVLCIDGEPTECVASVSGRVWRDDDFDGAEDPGEPGLAGVTVELRDGEEMLSTFTTDPTGVFAFEGLCAGGYVLSLDEATLPADLVPTSCEGEPCSPYEVTLETDDSAVTGLAFGWGAPPPEETCFYRADFWRYQYESLVQQGRCEILPPDLLYALLEIVEGTTARDWSQGDGSLDPEDALARLQTCADACGQAEREYLATLLNFAYNAAHRGVLVDTDGNGEVDSRIGHVLETVEPLLAAGEEAGCEDALDLAGTANDTPSAGGCPRR